MNVYYYLTTKQLVRVICVCQASKYSIQQKYDTLPISKNTCREYTLYTTTKTLMISEADYETKKVITPNQMTSTLKRSLNSICIDLDNIQLYEAHWFQYTKNVKLTHMTLTLSDVCQNEETVIKLNSLMDRSCATEVFLKLPMLDINMHEAICFPKGLKVLTLHMNDVYNIKFRNHMNIRMSQIHHHNDQVQMFPQNLKELIITGCTAGNRWLPQYLQSYILKPNLVLNKLHINSTQIPNKSLKSIPCDVFKITSLHDSGLFDWNDIIEWVSYKNFTFKPRKLILTCRVDYCYIMNQEMNTIMQIMQECSSPMEELHLSSNPTWRGEADLLLHQLVKFLTLILTSKVFPQLKIITHDVLFFCPAEIKNTNFVYDSIIDGVSLKINAIMGQPNDFQSWLQKIEDY